MTERKPPEVTFETWVDRQIRQAAERGEFDNLPGAGKPLPGLDKPYDELWWVKDYVRREGLSGEALLPTPLQLRKEIERLPATVRDLPSEQAVREVVGDLNRRIAGWLRTPSGPRIPIGPADVEHLVRQWHDHRRAATRTPAPSPPPPQHATPRHERPTWWRRLLRSRRGLTGR